MKPALPTALPADDAAPRPRSRADLFWTFTWLALQGFGGVLAVVQRELVEKKRWLTREQFLEEWAVAQIMPGPNVLNLAMVLGGRHFGLSGALAAASGLRHCHCCWCWHWRCSTAASPTRQSPRARCAAWGRYRPA